jgi:hypothetical protein
MIREMVFQEKKRSRKLSERFLSPRSHTIHRRMGFMCHRLSIRDTRIPDSGVQGKSLLDLIEGRNGGLIQWQCYGQGYQSCAGEAHRALSISAQMLLLMIY